MRTESDPYNLWSIFFTVLFVLILILVYLLVHEFSDVTHESYTERKEHWRTPFSQLDLSKKVRRDLIFVSIASYRDSECPYTVRSLLENAQHPQNLRIVVFEQNKYSDAQVEETLPQVRVVRTSYVNAKGPVWARYVIQQYWDGEEYVMQIDSHTRVLRNWDTILKNMLASLIHKRNTDKCVLTQYPPEYERSSTSTSLPRDKLRSGLYVEGFKLPDRCTRIQSEYTDERPSEPFESKAWAACFSFSKWSILRDAPYDPYFPFLFFGEELDITLRLFTRGWFFYSPNESIVFTMFNRHYRPTYWMDIDKIDRDKYEKCSRIRLYEKIGWQHYIPIEFKEKPHSLFNNINEYTLGNVRTLKEYEAFAEVDFFNQCVKGNNLDQVRKRMRPRQLWLNLHALFL